MNLLQELPLALQSTETFQAVLDAIGEPIFAKDLHHRWIACNQAFCDLLGQRHEAIIGSSDLDYFPSEQVAEFWRVDDEVVSSGKPVMREETLTSSAGITYTLYTRKYPLYSNQDQVTGLAGIITDLTPIKQRQEEIAQLERELAEREATIEHQRLLLEQVAVPVIQIWKHVLLLPLIGIIDSYRASRITESALEAIARANAQVIIFDVTGVPLVDTTVASHIMQGIQAARLLGCQSILVGISTYVAQTLVELGIDFGHITTQATLQQGLAYALKELEYRR